MSRSSPTRLSPPCARLACQPSQVDTLLPTLHSRPSPPHPTRPPTLAGWQVLLTLPSSACPPHPTRLLTLACWHVLPTQPHAPAHPITRAHQPSQVGKPLLDIDDFSRCVSRMGVHKDKTMPMEEQARRYRFIVHVEGVGGWADRLKHLLLSFATIIKQVLEQGCEAFCFAYLGL